MKFFIIILSILFISSCSTYDKIKENANDAYEWSKETAKDTVEGVKEVISD
jgi:PBP1b-binding outer membrane lipoprotein LpoB